MVSAPQGRPLLARGVNPWIRASLRPRPAGAAVTIAPPGLALLRRLSQGLTPLANNGRPSGAEYRSGHLPATIALLPRALLLRAPFPIRSCPGGLAGLG